MEETRDFVVRVARVLRREAKRKREGLIVCGGDDMRGWEVVSRAGDQQEEKLELEGPGYGWG